MIALTSLLVLDESWAAPVKHLGQRAGYAILGLNDAPRPKAKLLHLYVLIPSFQKQLPRDTTGLLISVIARGSLNLVNRIIRSSALFLSELFRSPHVREPLLVILLQKLVF
jgi:hypothetical protein